MRRRHGRFVRAGLSLALTALFTVISVTGLERKAAQMACCLGMAHDCGTVAPDCCGGEGPQLRKLLAAVRVSAPPAPMTSFIVLPLAEPAVRILAQGDIPPSTHLWPPSRGVPVYLFDSTFRL
jgi:hypothetical protein